MVLASIQQNNNVLNYDVTDSRCDVFFCQGTPWLEVASNPTIPAWSFIYAMQGLEIFSFCFVIDSNKVL